VGAEAIGTFVLVLAGAGAVCMDHAGNVPLGLGRMGGSLAAGLALCAMMLALQGISGAYFNPAATLAGLIAGRLSPRAACRYATAQLVGAAAAGVVLRLLFPASVRGLRLGAPSVAEGIALERALTAEAVVTFAWVVTLAATSWREVRSDFAPPAVGFVYMTSGFALAPMTGAAGNPARAFGPAFASGSYAGQATYWLGPLLGALAAAGVYFVAFRLPAMVRGQLAARKRQRDGDGEARQAAAQRQVRTLAMQSYQDGLELYRQGRLEEAARSFSVATEKLPEWPEPYYCIGVIYRDLGDTQNAGAFFDAAVCLRGACVTQDARMLEA
jgi:aquaporin Z